MDDDRRELTPRRRQHWRVETDTSDTGLEVSPARLDDRFEAKRLLWRDSATILVGVVLALLAVQLFLRFGPATSSSSPSPFSSVVVVGPGDSPGSSSGPGSTLGPVVDPSLGIDVRPTRRPDRTLPPTGTQAPTITQPPGPTATPRPTRTPTPTAAPTAPPTPVPTPAPTPQPTEPPITPAPPVADFTWSQDGLTTVVNFTDTSTGQIASWHWEFGGGGTSDQQNPTFDFGAIGVYDVTLTVTGPGGTHSVTKPVTVVGA